MADVPPEIIPYGKRSPWRNTLWQTFPRKKSHSRTSPGGKNHMWQTSPPPPPGRNPMAELPQGEIIPYGKPSTWRNTLWQTFPRKKSHSRTSPGGIIPCGKPSPRKKSDGRTSPKENNTIWQTFPLYGKSPPKQIPYVILGQHVRFLLGGGGRNPIDGNFYHMVFYPGGGGIHGGGILCDTGFALFWQHDVSPTKNPFHTIIINHISLEICLHVSLPINLHITSACKWVVNSVLNDWMRNRKAQIHAG